MSKIYDALQIAHGARIAEAQKEEKDSTKTSLPTFSVRGCSLPKLYYDSELSVLAQNIPSFLPNPEKNVIQFVGSREGEGTSTLIREFAMYSAQQSTKPILLIEADGRKPCQYQAFGIQSKPPIDQLLQENLTLDGVVSEVEKKNLFLATLSSNFGSSLSGIGHFGPLDMWKTIRDKFSLILIDSSPVTVTPESLTICGTVDGIVMVVEADKTRSVVANNVKDQILMREGNLLGIVFTKRKFHIPRFFYKLL